MKEREEITVLFVDSIKAIQKYPFLAVPLFIVQLIGLGLSLTITEENLSWTFWILFILLFVSLYATGVMYGMIVSILKKRSLRDGIAFSHSILLRFLGLSIGVGILVVGSIAFLWGLASLVLFFSYQTSLILTAILGIMLALVVIPLTIIVLLVFIFATPTLFLEEKPVVECVQKSIDLFRNQKTRKNAIVVSIIYGIIGATLALVSNFPLEWVFDGPLFATLIVVLTLLLFGVLSFVSAFQHYFLCHSFSVFFSSRTGHRKAGKSKKRKAKR